MRRALLSAFVLCLVTASAASAGEIDIVSFFQSPNQGGFIRGGPVDVTVRHLGDAAIGSFVMDISFDADMLQADAPTASSFFFSANFDPGVIDNVAGTITGISGSWSDPPGYWRGGSGSFAALHFTALAKGPTEIEVAQLTALAPDLSEVFVERIFPTTVLIPEPTALALALCAGVGLLLRARKHRPR